MGRGGNLMRVVFFGTSQYCLPILEALKKDLVLIVTREDKPVGRKQVLTPSATKVWAKKNNVPVITNLSDLRNLSNLELGLVADYGKIIPEEIFDKPKLGTFNIHFSKLPEFRGASPVQASLLRGDETAWVTIFKLEKTLDTGPILDQREFPIYSDDTAQTLYTRLFEEAAKYLPTLDFTKKLTPQTGLPTFCKMLKKDDGFVKLDDPNIYNKYRAFYPWPGIWTLRQVHTEQGRSAQGKPQRMKILKCHLEKDKLILDEIQFEGKKPQKATFSF